MLPTFTFYIFNITLESANSHTIQSKTLTTLKPDCFCFLIDPMTLFNFLFGPHRQAHASHKPRRKRHNKYHHQLPAEDTVGNGHTRLIYDKNARKIVDGYGAPNVTSHRSRDRYNAPVAQRFVPVILVPRHRPRPAQPIQRHLHRHATVEPAGNRRHRRDFLVKYDRRRERETQYHSVQPDPREAEVQHRSRRQYPHESEVYHRSREQPRHHFRHGRTRR